MKHLSYDVDSAGYMGEVRHPQEVLRELGIRYARAIPQSLGGQWWLFDCTYKSLPSYIRPMLAGSWLVQQYKLPTNYKNDT